MDTYCVRYDWQDLVSDMRLLRPYILLSLVFLIGVLSSCLAPKVQTEIPAFAKAVTTMSTNTKAAFDIVEQKYEEAQAFTLVVNYQPGQRFDPSSVRVLLSDEDLEARTKLLSGLQQYASQLEALAGGAAAGNIDKSSKSLGNSLKSAASAVPIKSMAKKAGDATNGTVTAVDALGNWLIEDKLSKNLPALIEKMQGPISDIRDLFKADIGTVNDKGEGRGLRFALWTTYSQLIQKQQEFLATNFKDLNPQQRTAEIEKLPGLVRSRRQADQTLAQTETCLDQMVKANAQLLDAVKTKRTMRSEIDALHEESARISDFYQSLNTSGK